MQTVGRGTCTAHHRSPRHTTWPLAPRATPGTRAAGWRRSADASAATATHSTDTPSTATAQALLPCTPAMPNTIPMTPSPLHTTARDQSIVQALDPRTHARTHGDRHTDTYTQTCTPTKRFEQDPGEEVVDRHEGVSAPGIASVNVLPNVKRHMPVVAQEKRVFVAFHVCAVHERSSVHAFKRHVRAVMYKEKANGAGHKHKRADRHATERVGD